MLSGSASAALSHVYARAEATFDDAAKHAKAFSTGRRNYVRQFNELYYARLNELKPHVLEHAEKRWAAQNIKLTHKVLNVEPGERTYIVGTVFIDSAAKPSTLTQVESEHWISDPRVPGGYRGDGEAVHLEDESGRIRLVGGLVDRSVLVSGLVAAMAGMETPSGCFEVVDVCYAGMPPLPPQPAPPPDACVAFVSGLRASPASPVTLEMQLLAEFLTGAVAPPLAAQIVQVVVAGDIMCLPPPPLGHSEDARANDRSAAAPLVAAVDAYLADIAAAVPLALMPGALDPTDSSLPQQPINPGLFAQCRQYSGFRSLSNPALLEVAGCLLLGSAGQNVDDIARYVAPEDRDAHAPSPCELAALSLQWRHIAPSAPDTLWCYPFSDRDPFILTHSPHVYFFGNQARADQATARAPGGQQTAVVAVPTFALTHTIVLLNLRTMQCSTMQFAAPDL